MNRPIDALDVVEIIVFAVIAAGLIAVIAFGFTVVDLSHWLEGLL